MARVDYDRIAHLYDEPSREHRLDPHLVAFLGGRPDLASGRARILDVGCGTGTQLIADRVTFPDVSAVGLDLFAGMLAVARARCPEISWVRGDASRLPFRSASFDYATNQFSYHHISDKAGFVREVVRVLRPGARFVMLNIDPWAMPNWILYRFFPEARGLDHRDFLPAESFAHQMRAAGFDNVRITREHRRACEPISDFLAYARQRHRASQLIALSDDQYQTGVRRVERAVAGAGDARATVDSEFCLLTIRGDKS
jgi:SAM-dependent methyltransferase